MKKIAIGILMLALASITWGQTSTNACLIVRGKHFDRVDAQGAVPFRLRYKGKELRQLSAEGVRVIMLNKGEMRTDACLPTPIRMIEPVALDRSNVPMGYTLPASQTCLEVLTYHDGSTSCLKWSQPAH